MSSTESGVVADKKQDKFIELVNTVSKGLVSTKIGNINVTMS